MKTIWWLLILILVHAGSASAAKEELRIAILLWRGETAAETGFKEGLLESGYQTNFEIFDSAQDLSKLGAILHSIKNNIEAYDYIYTFGTTVSRRAQVVIGGQIPQIFNIVTDPVAAGIVDDLDSPGSPISGGTDNIGIAQQLDEVSQWLTFKKLGLFFNPREKNSLIIRDDLHRYGKERGFEVIDFRCPPTDQILSKNLAALVKDRGLVDAVYLAPDSYLSSEASLIGAQLREAKVISISQVRTLIEHGVLIGVAGDYYDLGKHVATIVDRHQQGTPLEEIPVERFTTFKLLINQATADTLELTIDTSSSDNVELVE
ncbi:MAG: ABC transporter substrate-binding protein [Desulfocapsaceae bacterium]